MGGRRLGGGGVFGGGSESGAAAEGTAAGLRGAYFLTTLRCTHWLPSRDSPPAASRKNASTWETCTGAVLLCSRSRTASMALDFSSFGHIAENNWHEA